MPSPVYFIQGIILVAFLLSQFPASAQSLNSAKKETAKEWELFIKAFEVSDKTNPPPKNAILFIGSSSIRIWTNVAEYFPEHKVINRGFGGSQISDSVRYVERIVLPYKPKAIVFYAGDNDMAGGKTPKQIRNDFERFVYKVHWALPETKIFFISIKPSPSRWKFHDQVIITNQMIKDLTKKKKELTFIDVYTAMINEQGLPREELFLKDKLHLNQKGYELWTSIIKPYLAGL
jgi:lysophospholipase L1-like esterase